MPKNTPCDHYRCDGGPCRMLTPEELEPSPADLEIGRQLVAEGWYSTSSKFRHVTRFVEPVPRAEELLRPEVLNTPHGRRLRKMWNEMCHAHYLRTSDRTTVENRELTVKQYRAFRLAGGQTA